MQVFLQNLSIYNLKNMGFWFNAMAFIISLTCLVYVYNNFPDSATLFFFYIKLFFSNDE